MSTRRRSAVAVAALVSGLGLAGCGGDGTSPRGSIAAIEVSPDQLASITFTADGRSATFLERDGVFAAGPGASEELATVLGISIDAKFPLNAYRILTDVDPATPRYGLTTASAGTEHRAQECGTGCALEVTSDEGTTWRLRVGGSTFNGAGFYARIEGDPRVFLLIDATVADIITYAGGEVFVFPPSIEVAEVDRKLVEAGERGAGRGDPVRHPYLRQVRAAGQAEEAAERGRSSDALRRAATSVEGQTGAPEAARGIGAEQ